MRCLPSLCGHSERAPGLALHAQSPRSEIAAIFQLPALQQMVRLLSISNCSAAEAAASLLLRLCAGPGQVSAARAGPARALPFDRRADQATDEIERAADQETL